MRKKRVESTNEEIPQEIPTLPLEILVHIFEYLDDFDDLKNLTFVCKHWLKATQINKILKNYKLCFSFVTIGNAEDEPLSLFLQSNRVFSNIYFENSKINKIDVEFWSQWSESITEITFDYKFCTPDLPGGNFVELLKYTPRLKTLNLICSMHLFNQFIDELSQEDRNIVFENIKNAQELQLYFSEVCVQDHFEFHSWIDQMPYLKNIDFDVHSKKSPIPEKAYTEIFSFLSKYGTKVKGLHICDHDRALDKKVIQRLLDLKNMKLKAFDLVLNKDSSKVVTDFLCTQSDLVYLTVNGSFSLSKCFPLMPKLKEFAISNGPALDGFKVFNNVPKIESLGVAGLTFYDEDDLDKTYNLEPNPKMKELYLIDSCVDFDPPLAERLCECFQNIRLLNLAGAMIDDSSIRYIFQLKKLHELKLSNTQITDDGVTGTVIRKKRGSAKKLRLSLEDDSNETNLSINALTELEVLNVDFCKFLTTRSFMTFQFKKLKHLSAQSNHITEAGYRALGKNCPMLESLNLSKTTQIREKEIGIITKTMKGLETFELESCPHVDDNCLEQIMKNCKKLQTLDITKSSCNVKPIVKQMFERMKSLRRIVFYKERLYRCNYVT